MLIQLKYRGSKLRLAAGQLAAAVLCGSIVAACSGTIDTPSEENPPRRAEREQTPAAAAPNRTGSTTTPRAPAPVDDEEEEDDDTPTAPPPGAAVDTEGPADEEEEEEEDPAPSGDLSFASDIWPIFNGSCGPCHVTSGIVSNFGDPDVDQAFENSEGFENQVLNVIETGRMPQTCGGGEPGDSGCLSVADADAIEAWYEAGAPE